MLARGEDPANSLWVSECKRSHPESHQDILVDFFLDMFPGWNNNGASNDSATAWPHSTSAHITLSSLMWANQSNIDYINERDEVMMDYLREYQSGLDSPPIYDYPNYM